MRLDKVLLFTFPVVAALLAIQQLFFTNTNFGDIAGGIYLLLAVSSGILTLLFALVAHYRKWKLRWWQSLLISAGLMLLAYGLLAAYVRTTI